MGAHYVRSTNGYIPCRLPKKLAWLSGTKYHLKLDYLDIIHLKLDKKLCSWCTYPFVDSAANHDYIMLLNDLLFILGYPKFCMRDQTVLPFIVPPITNVSDISGWIKASCGNSFGLEKEPADHLATWPFGHQVWLQQPRAEQEGKMLTDSKVQNWLIECKKHLGKG